MLLLLRLFTSSFILLLCLSRFSHSLEVISPEIALKSFDTLSKALPSPSLDSGLCLEDQNQTQIQNQVLSQKSPANMTLEEKYCACAQELCEKKIVQNQADKKRQLTEAQKGKLEKIKEEYSRYQRREMNLLYDLCSKQLNFVGNDLVKKDKSAWCVKFLENPDFADSFLVFPKWSEEDAYYLLEEEISRDDQNLPIMIYDTLKKLLPYKSQAQKQARDRLDAKAKKLKLAYSDKARRPYREQFQLMNPSYMKSFKDELETGVFPYSRLLEGPQTPESLARSFRDAQTQYFDLPLFDRVFSYYHSSYEIVPPTLEEKKILEERKKERMKQDAQKGMISQFLDYVLPQDDKNEIEDEEEQFREYEIRLPPYILKTANKVGVIAHELGHFFYQESKWSYGNDVFMKEFDDVISCLYRMHQIHSPQDIDEKNYHENYLEEDFADLLASAYMKFNWDRNNYACELLSAQNNECSFERPNRDFHAPAVMRIISLAANSKDHLPSLFGHCAPVQKDIVLKINQGREGKIQALSCLDLLEQNETKRLGFGQLVPDAQRSQATSESRILFEKAMEVSK